jgi:TPR repeat protein
MYRVCLSEGIGVPVDLAAAAHYYQLAADQNHVVAQFIMIFFFVKVSVFQPIWS